MNWTSEDKPVTQKPEQRDSLDLTKEASIYITYTPWRSVNLFIALPYHGEALANADDREGSRNAILRAMLPLVESALVALRESVAELPIPCDNCGVVPAEVDSGWDSVGTDHD